MMVLDFQKKLNKIIFGENQVINNHLQSSDDNGKNPCEL